MLGNDHHAIADCVVIIFPVSQRFPEDTELLDAAKNFMLSCLKSFIATLKLRSKMYKKGIIDPPKAKSNFSMITYMEFFDGCNALSKVQSAAIYFTSLH